MLNCSRGVEAYFQAMFLAGLVLELRLFESAAKVGVDPIQPF